MMDYGYWICPGLHEATKLMKIQDEEITELLNNGMTEPEALNFKPETREPARRWSLLANCLYPNIPS